MITGDLVHRRIANFWGYGSFTPPVWYVGMQEGLGSETDLTERFLATDGKITVDIRRDMARALHHISWFVPPAPKIQPNFKYPISLHLYFKYGKPPTREDVRAYQLRVLGDIEQKDSLVLDLMPLPNYSTSDEDWKYFDYVGTREQYLDKYKPERIRRLASFIKAHRPRLVIFHSVTCLADWGDVTRTSFRQITRQMYFAVSNGSAFCVIPNGNGRGMSYARLYGFAERVRTEVSLT